MWVTRPGPLNTQRAATTAAYNAYTAMLKDAFGAEPGRPGIYRRELTAGQVNEMAVCQDPDPVRYNILTALEGTPPPEPLTDAQALEGMRQWDEEILRLREQEAARTARTRNPFEKQTPLE